MILPHINQSMLMAGSKLEEARAAVTLLHGRGSSAQDILTLAAELSRAGFVFVAPQAEGYTWYPNRFTAPIEQNEPYLSGALALVRKTVQHLQQMCVPISKIFIGGFSQGACLAAEYVIQNPDRYGGLLIFSGGYIGPLTIQRQPVGDLHGMPVFLGCSDSDPHIPLQRVKETTALFRSMGAQVKEKIYPNMGHTIIDEEMVIARELLAENS